MKLFLLFCLLQILMNFVLQAQVTQEWAARYDDADNGIDYGNALAVDINGNVYVTGFAGGVYATIKYDMNGDSVWVRKFAPNPAYPSRARALAIDNAANVYVTGGGVLLASQSQDIYTLKYNTNGDSLWSRRFNGMTSDLDWGNAIAIDDSQNVYVTGTTQVGTNNWGRNYVTIKYGGIDGIEEWAAIYNGPADRWDEPYAIAVDSDGYVYVTGISRNDFNVQDGDYATIKYTPSGDTAWVRRYDGPYGLQDEAYSLAIDSLGNVYVTGRSPGSNLSSDYFTIKYDSDGDTVWTARYDGGSNDIAYALKVDDPGNVYVTGSSPPAPGQMNDYVTVKYNSEGVEQWVARYDGPTGETDDATALTIDGSGNVYVTGRSAATVGISWDYVTVMYNTDGEEQWVARYNGPADDNDEASNVFGETLRGGSTIAVDASGMVYVTGRSKGVNTDYDYCTIKYSHATGIEPENGAKPTNYNLLRNFPNPFNPVTTIEYNLSRTSHVTLKIYNLVGQEVRTLVDQNQTPGHKSVLWDGRDNAGNPISTGIYIYRIKAGNEVQSRKMVLMK